MDEFEDRLYQSSHCASCRENVSETPFHYSRSCGCIYHFDCLTDLSSCIYHNDSHIASVVDKECIMPSCSSKTDNTVCHVCVKGIIARSIKILTNSGNRLSVGDLFDAVFRIKSLWTDSIAASVNPECVSGNGMFKRRSHPIVAVSWPIIWRAIRKSPDMMVIAGQVWSTWAWIESKLDQVLPKVILYSQISTYVEGLSEANIISFRTSVNLGRTKKFKAVTSTSVRKITRLNCYNKETLLDALALADHNGIPIVDLMKEDAAMKDFIMEVQKSGEALVANRHLYSRRWLGKVDCYEERFAPMWVDE